LAGIACTLFRGEDTTRAGPEAWVEVQEVRTAGNGVFEFINLSDTTLYCIRVPTQKPGTAYWLGTQRFDIRLVPNTITDLGTISLHEANRVFGRVTDTALTGLPEVIVEVGAPWIERSHPGGYGVETEDDGSYELWLPPSPDEFYPLIVTYAGGIGQRYHVYGGHRGISCEDPSSPEDLGFDYLGTADGTATFNGAYQYYLICSEPWNGVRVDALKGSAGTCHAAVAGSGIRGSLESTGAEDGNYLRILSSRTTGKLLAHLPDGNSSLEVILAPGHARRETTLIESKVLSTFVQVPDPNQAGIELDVVLGKGECLTGQVRTEEGTPVANWSYSDATSRRGLAVRASFVDANGCMGSLLTGVDSAGNYTFTSLPLNVPLYVSLEQAGVRIGDVKYAAGEQYGGPFTITSRAPTQGPTFTLYRAGAISGTITDSTGAPVFGARVELKGTDTNVDFVGEATVTDGSGEYRVDYVPPGQYELRASQAGFAIGRASALLVTRETTTEIDNASIADSGILNC